MNGYGILKTLMLDFPESIIHFPLPEDGQLKPLWELAADLIPVCDMLTDKGTEIAASFDQHVSCAKGCGVCCCQMVPLSPPEAAVIADVVDHLSPVRRNEVVAAFAAAREKLESAGIYDRISAVYSITTDEKTVLEINRRYFELSIPCPFLVDGACSIYLRRPSRCREYSVLSPASLCGNPFDNHIRRLPLTIRFCEALTHAWAGIANEKPVIVPLVKALDWVHDHPGIRSLCIDKSESFARTVLEFACWKANLRARERMKE